MGRTKLENNGNDEKRSERKVEMNELQGNAE
jgi:hypothetical protein